MLGKVSYIGKEGPDQDISSARLKGAKQDGFVLKGPTKRSRFPDSWKEWGVWVEDWEQDKQEMITILTPLEVFWPVIGGHDQNLLDKGSSVCKTWGSEYVWPRFLCESAIWLDIYSSRLHILTLRNKGLARAALWCLIIWNNLHFNADLCCISYRISPSTSLLIFPSP